MGANVKPFLSPVRGLSGAYEKILISILVGCIRPKLLGLKRPIVGVAVIFLQ